MKGILLLFLAMVCLVMPWNRTAAQKPYRGAEYRTIASMTYGRFEVRMKTAGVSGMLASFFTYYDPASPWNEIDVENMGRYTNESQFNTIVPANGNNHVQRQLLPFNPHAGFHTYGIEWTPEYAYTGSCDAVNDPAQLTSDGCQIFIMIFWGFVNRATCGSVCL